MLMEEKTVEIAYLTEKEKVQSLPHEVQVIIQNILLRLDTEYRVDRNKYEDERGYVVVVEKEEYFVEIKNKAYINCDDVIGEYVDKIVFCQVSGTSDI